MAKLFEVATVAFGLAGDANLTAVMDDLVRKGDPAILRDDVHQFLLDLLGRVAFGKAEAVGDAEDVGIDDNAFGFVEGDA
jgi:hypothetical protein